MTDTMAVQIEVLDLASLLKGAFQKADPPATYKFDWADFGDVAPTDMGRAVIDALAPAIVTALRQAEKS